MALTVLCVPYSLDSGMQGLGLKELEMQDLKLRELRAWGIGLRAEGVGAMFVAHGERTGYG